MDGVFLSPNEDEFVGRITEELEHFMQEGQHHRVLLFPPLSSRLRYLIHRTVDNVDLLSSFSVGEGWRRRTVICHSAVRLPSETNDQKPSNNPPRPHRPPQPWGRGGRGGRPRHGGEAHGGDNSRACVGSGRIKRPPWRKPDKALYVPKAMRKKTDWGEQENRVVAITESGGDVAQGGEICPKASAEDAQEELGGSEGGPGDVSVALGKREEPGEEWVSGKNKDGTNDERPPCPSSENRKDSPGQESRDKDCSVSLSSAHNKNPPEAEEQDESCGALAPESSETPCQLRGEDQTSWDTGKTSSLSERGSSNCCPELSTSVVVENQDKSHGNVSPPQERGEDFVNAGTAEGGQGFSQLESQDEEHPSVVQVEHHQNLQEAPNEPPVVPEPISGAHPSPPEDQSERWVGAPGQNPHGKVPGEEEEEEEKEHSGLADALRRDLHLSTGHKEENMAVREQSSLEEDCTAELLAEIVGHLTVKDISIEKISVDYSSYGEAPLSEGDFGHVTEIYDFSPSLKTENLMEAFVDFHESGFEIQWVDDTHALGIFSSPSAASQALGRRYPSLKIRPLIHATKQSKTKAFQRPKLLHLAKERPQTDTVVAKRLVTRALGLKHKQQDPSGTEELLPETLEQEE
ncbi:PREDICTED: R3H and coiled-coil domain-containing protein 1 isoform X1 [Calidris pugnax]|uniref:R3H and coiled-coil domain-containing protein 1 isoform X1 n=1 Tax=Calidris pugnax TaxID=198806 RepID=UPI00071DF3E9|nr:PREDICTED: R3H and coiled-coil domain-containing protein 1 isoform X1 [Calidris pugnax]